VKLRTMKTHILRTKSVLLFLAFTSCMIFFASTSDSQTGLVWHEQLSHNSGSRTFQLGPENLNLTAKASTVSVCIRPFVPHAGDHLLTIKSQNGQQLIWLAVYGAGKDQLLAFSLKMDVRAEPLVVAIPVDMLNPNNQHELMLRYLGYRVDLFVDGVLIDEEWPMGGFGPPGPLAMEVGSDVSDVGTWERAVTDAEIVSRNGGMTAVANRTDEFLGPEHRELQYWRPRGYNTNAGDAMPFYHDGVFHVFYLLDRRHHHSKWGLGAHQWGHISSWDLIHWTHYDPALTITEEAEASICTGSVFFDKEKFYAFYATRLSDRSERLGVAVSDDAIRFEKILPTPFAEPQSPFKVGPNRDPFVHREGDLFRMLVTADLAQPALDNHGGALEELLSRDLTHWSASSKPFLVPGYKSQPECSNLFSWRRWTYLLFGQDGLTHYRMSRNSAGPWTKPPVDVLDDPQAHVMKTARFGTDRRIGVAFVAKGEFGGVLAFRELTQLPDGTLGTRFVSEMIPAVGTPLTWEATALTSSAQIEKDRIRIRAADGLGAVAIENVPQNVRITATLSVTRRADFGVVLRGAGNFSDGLELMLRPALRGAEWRLLNVNSLNVDPFASIGGVEDLDRPVTLDIIGKDDVFDVCINGVKTLIDRQQGLKGNRLFLFVQGGDLTVTALVVRPLEDH